jgi:BirA family biotin operon repressor/biotin-[acetyl-CoA-carboxylase] ligase
MDHQSSYSRLREQTFVRTVEQFDELDSTNRYALQRVVQPPCDLPAVIVARHQTAGRGRGANRWWSGEGGLTFSLIVDDASAGFVVDREPRVALLAGLAVADVLEPMLPRGAVGLKWPNDVLVGSRKVCGILTEVPPQRRGVVVIGVGLNVNNSLQSAPPDVRESATALCDELQQELSLPAILLDVCSQIERWCTEFARDADALRASWSRRCVLTGQTITARSGTETVIGRCSDIHSDGSLIVETPTGRQLLRTAEHVRSVGPPHRGSGVENSKLRR